MDQSTLSQIGANGQTDSPTSPTVTNTGNESDERGTPPGLIERLLTANNGLFAIDLASGAETIEIGDVKLTKDVNALECSWDPADHPEKQSGPEKSVTPRSGWLNPPFSRKLVKQFAKKVDKELQKDSLDHLIFLCSAQALSNIWFHEHIVPHVEYLCVPDSRLEFTNTPTNSSSDFPAVLLSLGDTPHQFIELFRREGECFEMLKQNNVIEDIYEFIQDSVHKNEANPGLISTEYERDEPILNNVGRGDRLELQIGDSMVGYPDSKLLNNTITVVIKTWSDEGSNWKITTDIDVETSPINEQGFVIISVEKNEPSSFLVSYQLGDDLYWEPLPVTNIRSIKSQIEW